MLGLWRCEQRSASWWRFLQSRRRGWGENRLSLPPGLPMCWSDRCTWISLLCVCAIPKGAPQSKRRGGDAWKGLPEWLQIHVGGVGQFSSKEIVSDLGGAEPCRGIVIPIGVNAEGGLVAAACARADFPSEIDQLQLSVAANHAAAAFQNARLRNELDAKVAELRQARNELEMKVAQRTADLRRSEAYLAEGQRLSHCGSFAWNVDREGIYCPTKPTGSLNAIRRTNPRWTSYYNE